MYKLENWSVAADDPYTPPEYATLYGEVYGNPRFEDGTRIRTSYPVKSEGRVVTTKNGQYELGEPHPDYVDYMENQIGQKIDRDNPIKFI